MSSGAVKPLNNSQAPDTVEKILRVAVQLNASDIHLGSNNLHNNSPYLLRLRINGKLQEIESSFLNSNYNEIIARIKVLSKMDITAHSIPQDGKFFYNISNEDINFRVNIVPGINNIEEVCIRLVRNKGKEFTLDDMLMTENMRKQVDLLIHQKSGIFILNGPAGQGKTTTIYSILKELSGPDTKIITAEDPVEKEMPYVTHNQVSNKVSFADLGRGFMRQDADIIFIGEIRDEDSAQSAQQLAQTGHLVLTTLHTRDSIGVIDRLQALDIDTNSIASTLIGSLAQRLVPALCQECKVPHEYDQELLSHINKILNIPNEVTLYKKGPGCNKCTQHLNQQVVSKGTKGVVPIFFFFLVDNEMSELINLRKTKSELYQIAKTKGMLTLSQEALLRFYHGFIEFDAIKSYIYTPTFNN